MNAEIRVKNPCSQIDNCFYLEWKSFNYNFWNFDHNWCCSWTWTISALKFSFIQYTYIQFHTIILHIFFLSRLGSEMRSWTIGLQTSVRNMLAYSSLLLCHSTDGSGIIFQARKLCPFRVYASVLYDIWSVCEM